MRKRNVQSQGADFESGVAARESQRSGAAAPLCEVAATEEAIAVGQFSVVLEASLRREIFGRREFSGGGGPLLHGVGEAVVHLEAEDAAVAAPEAQDREKEDEEDNELTVIGKKHFRSMIFSETLDRFALGKETMKFD